MALPARRKLAVRLYGRIRASFEGDAPFEGLKAELSRLRAAAKESTVRGWLGPLEKHKRSPDGRTLTDRDLTTPDLQTLHEVANIVDVSVDYLLGADVPPTVSAREPIGELGRALVDHVIRDYARRAGHGRRSGLAAVLGGRLLEVSTPRSKKRGEPLPQVPELHSHLSDDRIVVHRGLDSLMALEVDPLVAIDRVSKLVFRDAEDWEWRYQDHERTAVRAEVRRLLGDVDAVAAAIGEPREVVLERLAAAALDPLDPQAHAAVVVMQEMYRSASERKELWEAQFLELRTRATEAALEALGAELGAPPTKTLANTPGARALAGDSTRISVNEIRAEAENSRDG
jgi:hypothetical protein